MTDDTSRFTMCPFASGQIEPDYNIKSMGMAALRRPESFESQLIMEGSEYWREGVQYSYKFPSSMTEYGEQLFASEENVISNSYPTEKTYKKSTALNLSEDVLTKKLSHNANERKRRKHLNALYENLRSLLPFSNVNMKKKVSNPAIVSGILKYIPHLRREIETLSRQRDELLSLNRISGQALMTAPAEYHPSQKLKNKLDFSETPKARLTEVSIFAGGQTLLLTVQTAHAAPLVFSRLFWLLEEEKLDVINASTFISREEAWHNIQVKAMECCRAFDTRALRLKIMILFDRSGRHFGQQPSNCFQG